MLTAEQITHIKETAKTLYTETQMPKLEVDHGYSFAFQNEHLVQKVMDTIGDSGLLYITTWENMSGLWLTFRDLDDYGVAQWLLQTATTFRILGFEDSTVYNQWIDQLTQGYCSHVEPDGASQVSEKDAEKALAIDDEYSERLPVKAEYKTLLHTNPWFVYLATLQLSYHEIYRDLLASSLSAEDTRRLSGVDRQ